MIFNLGYTRLLSNLIRFTRQTSTLARNNKKTIFLECRRLQNLSELNMRFVAISAKEKEVAQVNFTEKLEKDLNQLNADIRMRRVFKENFQKVFENLKQSGEIKSDQLLLLLKCCTKISFMCSERERVRMAENFWDSAEKLGLKFENMHFNELLNVYVGNNHKFSQNELIKKMEKAGVEPDLVTYRYLLRACCQQGDINKAKDLLDKMKNLNIPIDRLDFNSLILAYSKIGDFEKVNEILEIMESKGLQPMSVTYAYFLCGYIKHGKVEEFEKLFNQLPEKHAINLSNLDLLEIIYTLAKNKQESYIDMVIRCLSRNIDYDKHITNCMQRLLHEKLDSTALKLLETISPEDRPFNYILSVSRYTLDHFVWYRTPNEILKMCQTLEEKGYARAAVGYCLKRSFFFRSKEFFIDFIQQMKAIGMPDRVHYYWPMIIKESKKGNKEFFSCLKRIPIQVRRNSESVYKVILRNYVLSKDWKDDFDQLTEIGIPKNFLATYFIVILLKEKKLDEVEQLSSSYPVDSYRFRQIFNILFTNLASEPEKSEQVVNILYNIFHDVHLHEQDSSNLEDRDQVIYSLLEKIQNEEVIKSVLQAMLKKKMGISPNMCSKIVNAFPNEDVKELASSLSDPNLKFKLNENLVSLKSTPVEDMNNISKWKPDSIPSLKECINCMDKLAEEHKFKEALKLGEYYVEKNKGIPKEDFYKCEKVFKRLLMKVSDFEKNEGFIQDFIQLGVKAGILVDNNIHDGFFIIRNLLQRNYLAKAFEVFKEIFLTTGKPALCEDLLTKCIYKGDNEKVQQITDMISQTYSKNTAFSYLVFALANLGEQEKAKKILDTPGFVFEKELFLRQLTLKRFSTTLKNLVEALKNVKNFDMTDLYKILVRDYALKREVDEIQELWKEIQGKNILDEEFLKALSEFQIDKDTSRLLESLYINFSELKRNREEKFLDIPVQASILEEKYVKAMMGSIPPEETILLATKFAFQGNVEKTCSLLENCPIEKHVQKVAAAFIRSGKMDEYFKFLDFYASKGDFITLNKCFKVGGLIPTFLKNNEYFEKYKSLLLRCADETNFSNPIISCFVICAKIPGKIRDAEKIIEKYSHHLKDLTYSRIKETVEMSELAENFYENVLSSKKLKDLFSNDLHEFYNHIITLKYEEDKFQEVLSYLHQAEADKVKEKLDQNLIARAENKSKRKKIENPETVRNIVD